MANAGAQLALCNFYTTHCLSLDICWLNPKWSDWAFFFFLIFPACEWALMLRPTLSFYIWDVLWPPRCLSVPLTSFPAPLHSTLLSPLPLFMLTPSTPLCQTVEHQCRVTKTIRRSGSHYSSVDGAFWNSVLATAYYGIFIMLRSNKNTNTPKCCQLVLKDN